MQKLIDDLKTILELGVECLTSIATKLEAVAETKQEVCKYNPLLMTKSPQFRTQYKIVIDALRQFNTPVDMATLHKACVERGINLKQTSLYEYTNYAASIDDITILKTRPNKFIIKEG